MDKFNYLDQNNFTFSLDDFWPVKYYPNGKNNHKHYLSCIMSTKDIKAHEQRINENYEVEIFSVSPNINGNLDKSDEVIIASIQNIEFLFDIEVMKFK